MDKLQIARFESRLKHQSSVVCISWLVVIALWERNGLRELSLSLACHWVLKPQDLLQIACPNELVEIVVIELLVRIVMLFAIS